MVHEKKTKERQKNLNDLSGKRKTKRVPKIKICGITTLEEISYLNELPISYAGFVFCKQSKRNVSLQEAKVLSEHLNQKIKKIAVFLEPDEKIIEQLPLIGFDGVQIHRSYDGILPSSLFLWQAMAYPQEETTENIKNKILNQIQVEQMKYKQLTGILFDTKTPGSGETFPWENAIDFNQIKEQMNQQEKALRFILAGGLNCSNVAKGIQYFHPDIVDVSSGVEGSNGKKDRQKIVEFVRKVTDYE